MSKAEQTKAFIIEKTAPIFNMKGYAGTSLNDMTTATGLTKGSIYGNFANKDEVAFAVFEHNISKVTDIIRSEMEKCTTVRDQLLVYIHVYSDFLRFPFPVGGCPILNTAIEADDTHPPLRQKAAAAVNTWKNRIISLLEKGVKNKEFRAIADPEQTALTMIATIEGGIMLTKLTGKLQYLKSVLKSVEQMIRNL